MRSTVKARGGAVFILAGESGMSGFLTIGIQGPTGRLESVSLNTTEAALLAGEVERAAWAAQRQNEAQAPLRLAPYVEKYEAKQAAPAEHLGVDL